MNLIEKINIINEKIKASHNIIITSHINPDGDAAGSMIGLYDFINKKFGKKSLMVVDSNVSGNLKFLSNSDNIQRYDNDLSNEVLNADLIFILDLNDYNRLGDMAEMVEMSNAYKVIIDHHMEPKIEADLEFIDIDATSTGELVWKIISNLDGKISKGAAMALYTAIMTDTGSFRYERTDAETHRIVADLIDAGADPVKSYDMIYNRRSLESMKLLGNTMANTELYHRGKMSIMTLKNSDFEKIGASYEDTEGFSANTLAIEDVEIGLLLKESKDNQSIKISFRSRGKYSVRELAQIYGGGGHKFACGAKVDFISFEDLKKDLVKNAAKTLNLI